VVACSGKKRPFSGGFCKAGKKITAAKGKKEELKTETKTNNYRAGIVKTSYWLKGDEAG